MLGHACFHPYKRRGIAGYLQWFRDNQFLGNASKCHVLLSTDKQVHVNICTAQIENMQNEKLLGIKVLQLILN